MIHFVQFNFIVQYRVPEKNVNIVNKLALPFKRSHNMIRLKYNISTEHTM